MLTPQHVPVAFLLVSAILSGGCDSKTRLEIQADDGPVFQVTMTRTTFSASDPIDFVVTLRPGGREGYLLPCVDGTIALVYLRRNGKPVDAKPYATDVSPDDSNKNAAGVYKHGELQLCDVPLVPVAGIDEIHFRVPLNHENGLLSYGIFDSPEGMYDLDVVYRPHFGLRRFERLQEAGLEESQWSMVFGADKGYTDSISFSVVGR